MGKKFAPGNDDIFKCPCCGLVIPNPTLVARLADLEAAARLEFGEHGYLVINSGTRCAKHNAEVGGVKNSDHTRGNAADIKFCSAEKPLRYVSSKVIATMAGELFEFVYCINKQAVHVSVRSGK